MKWPGPADALMECRGRDRRNSRSRMMKLWKLLLFHSQASERIFQATGGSAIAVKAIKATQGYSFVGGWSRNGPDVDRSRDYADSRSKATRAQLGRFAS